MRISIRRLSVHLLLAHVLSGCCTTTKVLRLSPVYPANPENCEVVFLEKTKQPSGSYETIGKVETHIEKNLLFGGSVNLQDVYQELHLKACQLGGNAVMIDDYLESSAAEMSHVHVWATVLRVSQ